MHTPEADQYLQSLSDREKFEITSRISFERRGNIVKRRKHRYLTRNEYPHVDIEGKQFILRHNKHGYPNELPRCEYGKIRKELMDYKVLDNSFKERSVTGRFHVHFILI